MSIKNFLKSTIAEKPADAYDAFADEVRGRINSAMEDKRREVAQNMFTSHQKEDE